MSEHYPIPAPVDDSRFTFGLIVDVADVLIRHGYPPFSGGKDHIRLRQTLFGFLYSTSAPASTGHDVVTGEEC
ncbi:hypothetical protein [Amycolatopsis sp. NPDC102389]|uniref:hypothetical protein n=1 Tax=Amycolatopsis sp. NPDC102389 TaxID=3363941 RepID=UPI003824F886